MSGWLKRCVPGSEGSLTQASYDTTSHKLFICSELGGGGVDRFGKVGAGLIRGHQEKWFDLHVKEPSLRKLQQEQNVCWITFDQSEPVCPSPDAKGAEHG